MTSLLHLSNIPRTISIVHHLRFLKLSDTQSFNPLTCSTLKATINNFMTCTERPKDICKGSRQSIGTNSTPCTGGSRGQAQRSSFSPTHVIQSSTLSTSPCHQQVGLRCPSNIPFFYSSFISTIFTETSNKESL